MNLHEYQAKELLKKYQVPVQEGIAVDTVMAAEEAYRQIKTQTGNNFAVVKAQIHAGGRGKGKIVGTEQRGVAVAKSAEDVTSIAKNILGGTLVTIQTGDAGKKVSKILVAQDVYYSGPNPVKEFYLSILLDRSKGMNVVMYSTEGGMDIEEVAHNTPEKIFKEWVHPGGGLQGFQARKIAFNLGLSGEAFKNCVKFVTNLYNAYVGLDCGMLEINPLFKTSDEKIIAVDCKMNIDDNALMRHPDVAALRDVTEEDPTEVEAGQYNLNFVKLDGNVGCMVNGAGLAMATMDMIKLSGGEPANFLDVGGTANAQTVEAGFRIIMKDPNVKAILINIFGGIVRCDRVAAGVIEAYNKLGNINIPIIVRLQGTNAVEAKKLIDESGLKVQSAIQLSEAAALVKQAVA
ncbi:MAG TPA: ADP-forming succinate--CoA ligase subunit beta [Sediminibacterium sp.]|jgi:succinyl-CoA synthetase beta subunit|uniref:ADP-forming succinate--CoA ligase subunit beta n=1 Tax=Sediminibacterium sp. TaxID=1917865 RepID=UPI0008C3BD79|nr:ADP-forming succinate--CoA ligase subunit beta [Sediminibacterium sp.]OHC85584.1 MAG: succinate--CoA ligase subunit beta [Sphingobacteriia bacterium RIFOXYC2_FULL_35_18]OYY09025.1 MAG: succinate--CoA ligase subunit beta [Sphingobacteriia bacterium 35-36-14]OYZ55394.1 MAG: succinate--CoA ligase subunit beta [Sphingobacteriia bacterium 24-36-13]OZA65252.1 MAG: succinate--CoA ligase subunit beta [Sphingobacteriia bacterium 39-36-14]MBT9483490.1 ADP-forming succinate--CoA ligase subunit beta [S